jgi:hypothetical protein
LPGTFDGRAALLFPVAVHDHGDPDRVTRPWISVLVALDDGSTRVVDDWHEEPGEWDWLCERWPAAARELSPQVRRALEAEYEELVVAAAATWATASASSVAVRRLGDLISFLVPGPLHAWYRASGPAFVEYLERVTGKRLESEAITPEARLALLPTSGPGAVGWLADVPGEPGRDWFLWPGTLAGALAELGLAAGGHSPLAHLDRAPSGFTMAETVAHWPSDGWQSALRTLCHPTWLVELTGCDGTAWARVCHYVGGGEDRATWVIHDWDGEQHLVSFPRDPAEVPPLVLAFARTDAPARAGDRLSLAYAACAALLALADASATGLSADTGTTSASAERTLEWASLTRLACPMDLPEPDLAAGLAELEAAGWAVLRSGLAEPTDAGRAVLDALGTPQSAVAVRALAFADGPGACAHASGFLAVRTDTALWLVGVAEGWDCEDAPANPRLSLAAASPEEVLAVTAGVLDLR